MKLGGFARVLSMTTRTAPIFNERSAAWFPRRMRILGRRGRAQSARRSSGPMSGPQRASVAKAAREFEPCGDEPRELTRLAAELAQNEADIHGAVGPHGFGGERRQRALGRIADRARHGEGQPLPLGEGRGEMRLHVDGERAALAKQRRLGLRAS